MIKGINMKNVPKADKINMSEVVKNFDPTNVLSTEEVIGKAYDTRESLYKYDENFLIKTFSASNDLGRDSLYEVYHTIEEADSRVLRVVKYSESTILILMPNSDASEFVIDELTRLSGYLLKSDVIDTVKYLREYIDMYFKY